MPNTEEKNIDQKLEFLFCKSLSIEDAIKLKSLGPSKLVRVVDRLLEEMGRGLVESDIAFL